MWDAGSVHRCGARLPVTSAGAGDQGSHSSKTIFVRRDSVPECLRPFIRQFDLHDGFDGFEPVLPRNDESDRDYKRLVQERILANETLTE